MIPVPPPSRRKSDPTDRGYESRAGSPAFRFLHMLENATRESDEPSDEMISQGLYDYVADVLDQYACRYYADEDPIPIGRIIDRLSQLYELLIKANLPHIDFDPGTIEGVFEDFFELDDKGFCAKYNISDFYEMVMDFVEAAPPKDDYCALAHYLRA